MTRIISLLVDGKERYYGADSTRDTAVWVLERQRAQTFSTQDAQTRLNQLKSTYRLPEEPQLRSLD